MRAPDRNPIICFGEVLWDILPTDAHPGGAPMNVAFHLKRLGLEPELITRIGKDEYGSKLLRFLTSKQLSTQYVQEDPEHPTGLVYANMNDHQEVTYEIVFPSAWDFIEWNSGYEDILKKSRFFVYGSLSSRNRISSDCLKQALESAPVKVLDINLRKPHYQQQWLETLLRKSDILKMNEAELQLVTSWYKKLDHKEDQIRFIQDQFCIPTVIVTCGSAGALAYENGTLYHHPGFKVKVADTIGSGDAFLAGYLSQIIKGKSTDEALGYSCAMGAFIATLSGACPSYELSQVNELMSTARVH